MHPWKQWLIAGVALLIGAVVSLAIRAERRRKEVLREAVRDLGFVPAEAGADLVDRLTRLHAATRPGRKHPEKVKYQMENVFVRRITDGNLYLFDLMDRSGGDDSISELSALMIVSARLKLPAFLVLPKMTSDGVLAAAANKVLAWMAKQAGTPVEFPSYPQFGEQFSVSSPEPETARHFLGPRLHHLAEIRQAAIHAGGDVIALSRFQISTRPVTRQVLAEHVEQALRVYSAFAS